MTLERENVVEAVEEGVITVRVSTHTQSSLQALASKLGITPEDLVRVAIEDFLEPPDDHFQGLMDYLLAKNQDLYRRLA